MVLICLLGRSGSGKTVLEKHMEYLGAKRLISWTTRKMRLGEQNGIEYHFVNEEQFISEVKEGNIIEYTSYYGNYYGTHKDSIDNNAINVVVIEPTGMNKLLEIFRDKGKIYAIYIDADELIRLKRVGNRNGDCNEDKERLKYDEEWFKGAINKSHFLVRNNTEIEEAKHEIEMIYNQIKEEAIKDEKINADK